MNYDIYSNQFGKQSLRKIKFLILILRFIEILSSTLNTLQKVHSIMYKNFAAPRSYDFAAKFFEKIKFKRYNMHLNINKLNISRTSKQEIIFNKK